MRVPGKVCIRQCRVSITYVVDGKTYSIEFDLVNKVKLSFKPIVAGRDSYGCSSVPGYDVKGEFNSMPSDNAAFGTYLSLMGLNAANIRCNVIIIDKAGNNLHFPNVLPYIDSDLSGDGQANEVKVLWDCILTANDCDVLFS